MKMSGDVSTAEALMMAAAIFTLFSAAIFGPKQRKKNKKKMGQKY